MLNRCKSSGISLAIYYATSVLAQHPKGEKVIVRYSIEQGFPNFSGSDPKINIFDVGTPLYLFDSIPQINVVKIAVSLDQLLSQSLPLSYFKLDSFVLKRY